MAVYERVSQGKSTVEYLTLRENFKYLAENLQHNLSVVAAELFSENLILSPETPNGSDKFEKASKLLTIVLSAVESNARYYKAFISSLDKLGLSVIVKTLTASKDLQAPPTAASNEVPSFMKESQKPRTSRNEDSFHQSQSSASKRNLPDHSTGVATSKSNESNASGKDSAFSEDQSLLSINDEDYQNSEGLPDKVKDNTSSSINQPVSMSATDLDADDSDWGPINFSTPNSHEEVSGSSSYPTTFKAVASSEDLTNSKPVYGLTNVKVDYSHRYEMVTMEKENKQQKAEIECLKKQHDLKDEEFRKVQEDKQKALRIVKEKDDMILKLHKDRKCKDELIAKLESDKDKIKTEMSELEQKCQKAMDMQKEAEQRTSLVSEEFKKKEALLMKELNDVKDKEEKALHERELIEKKLIKLKLEKEREMRKLEQRNHQLEKTEVQLRSKIEKQKIEKDRDNEKQKREIAEKDKAFAEQGVLLANSQKELAENKQKLAENDKKNLEVEVEELKKKLHSMQMKEKDPE